MGRVQCFIVRLVVSRQGRRHHGRQSLRRARDRRYKARRRAGVMAFVGEIDGIGLNWLIANHYLDEADVSAGDMHAAKAAVGEAVTTLLRVSSQR